MADNPFNDNPFATNHANGTASSNAGPWSDNSAGAWAAAPEPQPTWGADVSTNAFDAPAPSATVPAASGSKMTKEERGLAKREAELQRREADLARREAELANASGTAKNWPPFIRCTYHDIRAEIPAHRQGMVRCAYYAYLGLVLALFFNFVGTAAYLIGMGGSHLSTFLWGGLYLIGGVPLAWWLWYRRLYSAAIKDSAFQYAVFFTFYMAHLIFCGWSVIAPPILNSSSHTGFWEAITTVGDNTGVGVMYFIGAAIWALEFIWSFWVLKLVYSAFRGGGHTLSEVRRDAQMTGVRSAV